MAALHSALSQTSASDPAIHPSSRSPDGGPLTPAIKTNTGAPSPVCSVLVGYFGSVLWKQNSDSGRSAGATSQHLAEGSAGSAGFQSGAQAAEAPCTAASKCRTRLTPLLEANVAMGDREAAQCHHAPQKYAAKTPAGHSE